MKVRVQRSPPSRAGATSVMFGTTLAATSPRPIQGPGSKPDFVDARLEAGVRVEVLRRLVSADCEVGSPDQYDRHSDAVDLTHVGCAHRLPQHAIACDAIARPRSGLAEGGLRGAPADPDARDLDEIGSARLDTVHRLARVLVALGAKIAERAADAVVES